MASCDLDGFLVIFGGYEVSEVRTSIKQRKKTIFETEMAIKNANLLSVQCEVS